MTTRIYYPNISFNVSLSEHILLEGNSAHHLINVLRRKIGESILLFDGKNNEYHTIIDRMDKKRLWLNLQKKMLVNRESPLFIHLIQAISKGDRMDWVVQKAIELGVSCITPIMTQHNAVKLDTDRMHKKIEHWQNIAISACEQCGRNVIPVIHPVNTFDDILKDNKNNTETLRWILHPTTSSSDSFFLRENKIHSATLLIGPEGGFSETEIFRACQAGYTAKTLGPRIFRTETAALATISVLQTYYGDWLL